MTPTIHTTEQLQRAVSIISKVIAQIPYFHLFTEYVAPLIPDNEVGRCLQAMTKNAAMDSTLLNLRCFNEFFKTNGKKDDIRAYHFPGSSMQTFLDDKDVTFIDKYLAHITAPRLDVVSKSWPLDDYVVLGLNRGTEWLSFIDSTFPLPDQVIRKEVRDVHEIITRQIHKLIRPNGYPTA